MDLNKLLYRCIVKTSNLIEQTHSSNEHLVKYKRPCRTLWQSLLFFSKYAVFIWLLLLRGVLAPSFFVRLFSNFCRSLCSIGLCGLICH